MRQPLLVYVERLREGKTEVIDEEINPQSLHISEEELLCTDPITVEAEVYLAEAWLIVRLSLSAKVVLPCSLCNEPFRLPISVNGYLHEEPLENITGGVFDLLPLIRETLLLEVPFYPQCGGTRCLHRGEFDKFIKKNGTEEGTTSPFRNL